MMMKLAYKTTYDHFKNNCYINNTILVVDDNKVNYLLIKALLKSCGATIMWAENGYRALEMIDMGRKVDFVFMDYNMPGINGYETTRLIRERQQNLPIVTHSSSICDPEFDKIKQSYNGSVTIPITSLKLYSVLKNHLN